MNLTVFSKSRLPSEHFCSDCAKGAAVLTPMLFFHCLGSDHQIRSTWILHVGGTYLLLLSSLDIISNPKMFVYGSFNKTAAKPIHRFFLLPFSFINRKKSVEADDSHVAEKIRVRSPVRTFLFDRKKSVGSTSIS